MDQAIKSDEHKALDFHSDKFIKRKFLLHWEEGLIGVDAIKGINGSQRCSKGKLWWKAWPWLQDGWRHDSGVMKCKVSMARVKMWWMVDATWEKLGWGGVNDVVLNQIIGLWL